MKRYAYLLCLPFLWMACTQPSGVQHEITELETTVDAEPTFENVSKLIGKYDEYIRENPTDTEMNGRYLYRSAAKRMQTNNIRAAFQHLERGITEFPSSSATANSLFLMGEGYRTKFKVQDKSNVYYAALLEAFQNDENAATAKTNKTDDKSLADYIEAASKDIYQDSTKTRLNPAKTKDLVSLYKMYAAIKPTDAKSPDYLYETYEVANAVRLYKDALWACKKLYTEYPEHEKAGTAMFLTGYLYENELAQTADAKATYEAFLQKYPKHDFADDAEFALANLGKSPDQILKELQEKNKANEGK